MYWPFQIGERIIPQYGKVSKYKHDFGCVVSTLGVFQNELINWYK